MLAIIELAGTILVVALVITIVKFLMCSWINK
jgi:hypothetical protein